jgi:aminopeptidase N
MDRRQGRRRARTSRVTGAMLMILLVPGLTGVASATPEAPGQPRYQAGADGIGDPYFPYSGNTGYDVQHYHLDITYTPPVATDPPTPVNDLRGQLEGVATIDLVATEDLDAFNLDLRGMEVESVTVDGKPLRELRNPGQRGRIEGPVWWHEEDDAERRWELTLQPRPKLKEGQSVEVVVTYGGETTRPRDIEGALYGWVTTRDGAMVASEPDGSMTWYPVNDHPTDKATYSFEITVPEGKVAVANGLPSQDPVTEDGWTTWYWDAPDLQASYLTTATIGDFEMLPITYSSSGVPILDFVDTKLTANQRSTSLASLSWQAEMLDFFEDHFGPYPFNSYGAIVDNDSVGYALETQTRPIYSGQANEGTVAHEAAHMWLGNAVSPGRWQDIWLNEGWATYATWMWNEHRGIRTIQQSFDNWYAPARTPAYWALPIGDPGPLNLFATQVYNRGAGTLHALREKVGDEVFFEAAREWVARYDDSTATTEDFIALYEEISGQDLAEFFDIWLFRPEKPVDW